MALFLDLDNTLLPSKAAYDFAILKCASDWEDRKLGGNFLELYEVARKQVKSQLEHHSSNRLRLLCFKLMLESIRSASLKSNAEGLTNKSGYNSDLSRNGGFKTRDIQDVLWLEERYFFHFLSYLTEEKKKEIYQNSLFPLLISLSKEFPIFLTTNETLRTQLVKIQGFLPDEFRFTLITSEEVGFEKPTKEFFQYVLKKVGEDPKDCLILGDSWEDDILGANKHAISGIHIPDMWGEGDLVKELNDPVESQIGSDSSSPQNPIQIWRASNVITGLSFARSWFFERQK